MMNVLNLFQKKKKKKFDFSRLDNKNNKNNIILEYEIDALSPCAGDIGYHLTVLFALLKISV